MLKYCDSQDLKFIICGTYIKQVWPTLIYIFASECLGSANKIL